MLKDLGMSIFVGLISAFLVSGLAHEMWDIGWNRAVVVGVIVFIFGVAMSRLLRRTIPTDQD